MCAIRIWGSMGDLKSRAAVVVGSVVGIGPCTLYTSCWDCVGDVYLVYYGASFGVVFLFHVFSCVFL